jgi:hypothetical protein
MSTSNLRQHAKICWGEETVNAASNATSVKAARTVLAKLNLKDGSITAVFKSARKERVTFLHQQHTRAEIR